MTKKFQVNFWGSHPDDRNDDCFYGVDCTSRKEAMTIFRTGCQDTSVQYVQIVGPGINKSRKNPSYCSFEDEGNSWKDEISVSSDIVDDMLDYI